MRLALVALLLGSTLIAAPVEAAQEQDVFRSVSYPSRDLSALPQWTDALARMRAASAALRGGDGVRPGCTGLAAAAWCAEIAATTNATPDRQLFEINRFVNALVKSREDDLPPAGVPWPGLDDALQGRGGRVAAVVAKYVSLREVGFPANALRIVIAEDTLRGNPTILLLGRTGGQDLILVSGSDTVRDATQARNLRPFYSFNETTLWMHVPQRQEISP
jgi:predicted transglutaminase-like cysteine proteinase